MRFHGADWPAIRDRVFGRIDPIAAGGREYRRSGSPNVTLIEGTARFVADKVLDVEGRLISAPQILVAAGGRPVIPPIPGLVETGFHTSDSIMRLDALPERLGIIGGGYIACEMGHVFSALGSRVSMFNRSDRLLRTHDDDISTAFTAIFAERVDLHLRHMPTRVERRGEVIVIHCQGEEIAVDELLVATGREPNSDLLDAESGGLTLHHHGTIVVDAHMRTGVDGVWAIGDIANQYQLKHVANAEAAVAFWNIAHPDDLREIDYRAVPAAVFTNPQIAAVGLTERDARAARSRRRGGSPRLRRHRLRLGARGLDLVRQGDRRPHNRAGRRRPHHGSAGRVTDPAADPGDPVRPDRTRPGRGTVLDPPGIDGSGGERTARRRRSALIV